MSHIEKTALVHAPADRIFALLIDPARASDLNPELKLLSQQPSAVGGYDSTWEYKMAGVTFSGATTMIECVPPRQMILKTTGGIPSTWVFTLEPQGDATQVTVELDYVMPGALLGKAVDKLVLERQNEKSIERYSGNLKRIAESGAQGG
jgi:carbon monoxide dehydrogenase subunit G